MLPATMAGPTYVEGKEEGREATHVREETARYGAAKARTTVFAGTGKRMG